MKIFFAGDIMGKAGRRAIAEYLPQVITKYSPDICVANGENAAAGYGITKKIYHELRDYGINVITTGNHAWDQKDIVTSIDSLHYLLRPLNFPHHNPGKGHVVFNSTTGKKILVINIMGIVFMEVFDNPFHALDNLLTHFKLGENIDAIIVDIHAETTSEKQAIAHHLNGRVSMVVGSHTHTPTSDVRILDQGTALQSDSGMCGDYDSIIGMSVQTAMGRFFKYIPRKRMEPATNNTTLCGIVVEIDDNSGQAISAQQIIYGDTLVNTG